MIKEELKNFEGKIKEDIPLAKALDFSIDSFQNNELSLSAPFIQNKNDKNTVFAGSQASLALLSGWCLASLFFKSRGVDIVAAVKTEMHYKKPLETDFIATAKFTDFEEIKSCELSLEKKGRGKVSVEVELNEKNTSEIKAVFSASYFVSKKQNVSKG